MLVGMFGTVGFLTLADEVLPSGLPAACAPSVSCAPSVACALVDGARS
jgi:hypothetical protein